MKRVDCNLDNVPSPIAACCTLHNILESFREGFNEELFINEVVERGIQRDNRSQNNVLVTRRAVNVRNALRDYFVQHPL